MKINELITLKNTLRNNHKLIKILLSTSKEEFVTNQDNINITIGMISELKEIIYSLNENIYILNPELYNIITPIKKYGENLFTNYKIVNAYKLYDFLKLDLQKLKIFLDKLGE